MCGRRVARGHARSGGFNHLNPNLTAVKTLPKRRRRSDAADAGATSAERRIRSHYIHSRPSNRAPARLQLYRRILRVWYFLCSYCISNSYHQIDWTKSFKKVLIDKSRHWYRWESIWWFPWQLFLRDIPRATSRSRLTCQWVRFSQ